MTNYDFWTFIVEKKITSSDILTASATNIAQFVWNWVILEDVIIRTDGTGLAWGTNFQLLADGIVFFAETVANLWADTIMDADTASVTGIKALLETWTKYVSVQNTAADWTWAWVATVQLICRKLDNVSTGNSI